MKKALKKLLASLLVAAMVLTAAPLNGFVGLKLDINLDWLNFDWLDFSTKSSALASSGSCGENVTYTFNKSTGELVISGTGKMENYSWSSSPFYYNSSIKSVVINNGVTSIGEYAFYDCTGLTSVTIPNSVTSIGNYAFEYCVSLTSITIPNSVTSIGNSVFYGCTGLTNITIPNSVTSIGSGAFEDCTGLTSVTIPDSVTSIGDYAFEYCESLTSITIPNSVTSIGIYAFRDCTGLTSITIPNSVTSIGDSVFYGCTGLTSVTIPDSVTNLGDYVFYNCIGLTSITIPNSVTSIGDEAFEECTGLTSITIPNSVTSIGDYAFYGCAGITSITIGNNVTSIGYGAFFGCTGLASITIPSSVTSIGVGAFAGCSDLTSITVDKNNKIYDSRDNCNAIIKTATNTLICGCQNTVIPDDVTNIDDTAFGYCTGLTSVTIPNSVTSIGNGAFEDCTGLTSVTIGNSVASIGDYAFRDCTGLTSITIPSSVTSIGNSVFYGCTGLTSVTIGNSVASIGDYAFRDCTGLTSVTIPDSVMNIGYNAFDNTDYYNNSENWDNGVLYISNYLIKAKNTINGEYKIKDGTKVIADEAFYNCWKLTSVTIPNSVTSIGEYAFNNCTGLTSVTIPNSVTSISDYTFYDCTGLTSITIPNSVTSIGNGAFEYCKGLTNITIPDSVTSIGDYAFEYCTGLTSITIPDSVTNIGNSAFYGCTGLTSVTIGNSVASIGDYAFDNTDYYNNSANWDNGVLYIGNYLIKAKNTINGEYKIKDGTKVIADEAFYNCWKLTSITIPDSVIRIGDEAFRGCTGFKSITIPDSVTSIGDYAFGGCTGLTSITINKDNKVYDSRNNCNALIETATNTLICGCKNTVIPDSVTSISNGAFYYCYGLTDITIPDSVTNIGYSAFAYCTGLTSITIPNSVTSIGGDAFYDVFDIEYHGSAYGAPWGASHLNCSDGTFVFSNSSKTTILRCSKSVAGTVKIPDTVTAIGDFAFCNAENMTGIIIPDSVTSIGMLAFAGCPNLTNVKMSQNIKTISDGAFAGCNISDIYLPASLEYLGMAVFAINKGLNKYSIIDCYINWMLSQNEVLIDDLINEYGENYRDILIEIFDNFLSEELDELLYINYPINIMYLVLLIENDIPANLISGSTIKVTIDESNPYFCIDGYGVIYNKDKTECITATKDALEDYVLPNTVKTINDCAFGLSASLTEMIIPDGVTSIGDRAFSICLSLEYVHIPASVTTIGDDILEGCKNAYICSDSEDCYAKKYAEQNGYKFMLCNGHTTSHSDMSIEVNAFDSNKWQKDFTISGKVSVNTGFTAELSCEIGNIPLNNGYFSISSDSLAEGANSITFTAKDSEGAIKRKTVSYKKDVSAPTIDFNSEYSGWYKELNIKGTAADTYSGISYLKYSVDGGEEKSLTLTGYDAFTVENVNLPAGEHTLKIIAVDNAGNTSENTISYKKDTTGPVISSVECNPSKIWSKYVNVTVTASDSESGLQTLAYSFDGGQTWQKSNTKKYTENTVIDSIICVRDSLGNVTCYDSSVVLDNIDTVSPEIEFGSFNSNKWYSSFTISGSASDNLSGVAEIGYGTTILSTESEKFSLDSSVLAEGSRTITIWATDRAGNKGQQTVSYKKDISAPVISFSGSYSNWSQSVTVNGTVKDTYSGVGSVKYAIDGGFKHSIDLSSGKFTINNEDLKSGVHTLTVYTEDNVGNTSEKSITYKKDTKGPDVSVSTDMENGVWKKSITVTVSASDSESGLASSAYSFDGGATWQSSPSKTYTENTELDGVIMVKDKVGNVTTYEKKVVIERIDNTAPSISKVTKSSEIISPKPVSITVSASDDQSGVAQYSFDGGKTWQKSDTKTYTQNTTVSAGTIKVKDEVGNISAYDSDVVIDNILENNISIKVVDDNNKPVSDASVYFNFGSANQYIISTNSNGVALQFINSNSVTICVFKEGYLPQMKTIPISNISLTEDVITLEEKPMVDGEMTTHRMTKEEIEAAGIDLDDPDNQYVAEVVCEFTFKEKPESGSSEAKEIIYTFDGPIVIDSKPDPNPTQHITKPITVTNDKGEHKKANVVIPKVNGIPMVEYSYVMVLDVPVRASCAKEFFNVGLYLINNASSDFNMTGNKINLSVPSGLTLMQNAAGCDSQSISFDNLAGQETKSFNWIIRGDEAGKYKLVANYSGTIDKLNIKNEISFEGEVEVYAMSGLTMVVEPYTKIINDRWLINVGLRNDSPIDVIKPNIEIDRLLVSAYENLWYDEDGNAHYEGNYLKPDVMLLKYELISADGNITEVDEIPDILQSGQMIRARYRIGNVTTSPKPLELKESFIKSMSGYPINVVIVPFDEIDTDGCEIIVLDRNGNERVVSFDKNLDYYAINKISTEYNPNLSYLLMCIADMAYSPNGDISRLEKGLESLGFEDGNKYISGVYSMSADDEYSVAFSISQKELCTGEKLVLIDIRGTGNDLSWPLKGEWLSNLFFANPVDNYHYGFSLAADEVYRLLKSLVKQDLADRNIKYMVTGHSRGAAVANIVSKKLTDDGVSQYNLFDYNFACPDVAFDLCTNWNLNKNMFNVCNCQDFIAYLPGIVGDTVYSKINKSNITAATKQWGKYGRTMWYSFDWNDVGYTTLSVDRENIGFSHNQWVYIDYLSKLHKISEFKSFEEVVSIRAFNLVSNFVGSIFTKKCPVDMTILDENDSPIAAIINNEPVYYDTDKLVLIFTNGDECSIYVHGDGKYHIKLEGTDDGIMTLGAQKVSLADRQILDEAVYENVSLKNNKQMICYYDSESASTSKLYVIDQKSSIVAVVNNDGTESKYEPNSVKSVSIGNVFSLNFKQSATIKPSIEANNDAKYTVEYKSSNPKIATVDKNGNVYGAKKWSKSTATITCTVTDEYGNQVSDTTNVTVGFAWWQWIIGILLFGWIWY